MYFAIDYKEKHLKVKQLYPTIYPIICPTIKIVSNMFLNWLVNTSLKRFFYYQI